MMSSVIEAKAELNCKSKEIISRKTCVCLDHMAPVPGQDDVGEQRKAEYQFVL